MKASAQLELDYSAPAPPAAPQVTPEQVEQLVAVLRDAGDWISAKDIAAKMGEDVDDRDVRAIASIARPVVVSFPGSPGYKLWGLCTVAEITRCIHAFHSQGSDMIKCAVVYRVAYHKHFGGAPEDTQAALKRPETDV
ncbi:MAG: hypothetical protein NTV51_10570 [Verrucomicrobia bacterium]|nr:hypothetical protein [Verrucomicrobiota bacterium]